MDPKVMTIIYIVVPALIAIAGLAYGITGREAEPFAEPAGYARQPGPAQRITWA